MSGCFLSFLSPLPDMRTSADKAHASAHAIEPKCKSMSEQMVESFASPSAIDSVEPAYTFVPSTASSREARLRGALIHLKPVTTMSREAMVRGFECHEARVTLGSAPPFADDPYVLPNHWLDIDVDSEGDGFAVQIRAETFKDAQRVLERAKLFVASRPAEVVTVVPAAVPSAAPAERPTASLPPTEAARSPAEPAPGADSAASQPGATAK
jgi:hypothetical protein